MNTQTRTIREIYSEFCIPPNLAQHRHTVAKVVCSIRDHWVGDKVDWSFIIKAALLHDLGNIVKFNFEAHLGFLGMEASNVDYWRGVQKKIVQKYGADDHIASGNMLKEIGITGNLLDVIQDKSFSNAIAVSLDDDWYSKILLYADMRVMPHGIVTLEERLSDVRSRMPQYTKRPDFEDLLNATRNIENQLIRSLDKNINEIDWGKVAETEEEFSTLIP